MTNAESVRFRDIPRTETWGWISAAGTVLGYAVLGVMLAELSTTSALPVSAGTKVLLAVLGASIGGSFLAELDRELREVSA